MARNNQGGRGGNARGRNNNPEGHNQFSGGLLDYARERPVAAAATAAGAVAAGIFLWSKRSQIGDQLSTISDQLNEWSENNRSSASGRPESSGPTTGASQSGGNSQGSAGA